jgi:hypothetical protein
MHRSSKRSAFQRILNDMLRFSPEQLDVMLKLGRKVRSAKRSLKSCADEAQQFVDSMNRQPRQLELTPQKESYDDRGRTFDEN